MSRQRIQRRSARRAAERIAALSGNEDDSYDEVFVTPRSHMSSPRTPRRSGRSRSRSKSQSAPRHSARTTSRPRRRLRSSTVSRSSMSRPRPSRRSPRQVDFDVSDDQPLVHLDDLMREDVPYGSRTPPTSRHLRRVSQRTPTPYYLNNKGWTHKSPRVRRVITFESDQSEGEENYVRPPNMRFTILRSPTPYRPKPSRTQYYRSSPGPARKDPPSPDSADEEYVDENNNVVGLTPRTYARRYGSASRSRSRRRSSSRRRRASSRRR